MLVLTRKVAEKLFIGNDICVTVVRLDGGQVRLGIEAPREIHVLRAELIVGAARARLAPLAPKRPHGPIRVRPHPTRETGSPRHEPSQ